MPAYVCIRLCAAKSRASARQIVYDVHCDVQPALVVRIAVVGFLPMDLELQPGFRKQPTVELAAAAKICVLVHVRFAHCAATSVSPRLSEFFEFLDR